MARSVHFVCAYFVTAVIYHVLCMSKKGGFPDDCKYEFGYLTGVCL